ncbi:COG1835 Predicted acyltransferases [Candidatus Methylopumilus planktonicus]|uniref:acyltransferase family protein n=1 Tax=Candidatus Methylopumilus planktonicus TaxID=1581557 RepID=UPI003BEF084F
MQYRPEIDGLRALAVLMVICFHAKSYFFNGGFVGVDVFFVISGFLITSILLEEINKGHFSLVKFYERRARRILPALFFVTLISIPLAWIFMTPVDMLNFSKSLIAIPTFLSNIFFLKHSGYFDLNSELKPLIHSWSLAIEEQFYIIFPVFLFFITRYFKKIIPLIFIVIIVASLFFAQYKLKLFPEKVFYLLPYRSWELTLGSLIALSTQNKCHLKGNLINQLSSLLGLMLILLPGIFFSELTPFPGINAIPATFGTAMIILSLHEKTLISKFLQQKILVSIGLISYSLYLWHQPLFAFIKITNDTNIIHPANLLILFGLSWVSYKYIETPFRTKGKFTQKQIFIFSGLGSLIILVIGGFGYFFNGFADYYLKYRINDLDKNNYQRILSNTSLDMYDSMNSDQDCIFWAKDIDALFIKRYKTCSIKYRNSTIILGDSHAMNIYNAITENEKGKFIVGLSQGGCRPYDKKSICPYETFLAFIKQNKSSIQQVIFHQSGSYLIKDINGRVDSDLAFIERLPYSLVKGDIEKIIVYLEKMSKETKVVWLGPFPEARVDFKNFKAFRNGFYMNPSSIERISDLDSYISERTSGEDYQFTYISFTKNIKIESEFLEISNCITYRDRDHFSKCGERAISKDLKKVLEL